MATRVYTERRQSVVNGLARGREAQRQGREAARRLFGQDTGWYVGPDWRLSAGQASHAATLAERRGWRAESFGLGQGVAYVEVRDLAVRGMPLVARLRTLQEARAWLAAHPGRRPAGPRREREATAR